MKRIQLFTLLGDLDKLDNLTGVKFNFVVDRNRTIIEKEVEDTKKVSEPSKDFQEYDRKRIELLQKYAEKDDAGNPKFTQANEGLVRFDIPSNNMKKFQKEMEELMKTSESAIQFLYIYIWH